VNLKDYGRSFKFGDVQSGTRFNDATNNLIKIFGCLEFNIFRGENPPKHVWIKRWRSPTWVVAAAVTADNVPPVVYLYSRPSGPIPNTYMDNLT